MHLQTWGTYYISNNTGTWNGWFDGNGRVKVYLQSQDTSGNTSYIKIEHYIVLKTIDNWYSVSASNIKSSYRANQGAQGGTYQTVTGSASSPPQPVPGREYERLIGTTYHTVWHNADGSGRLYVNGSISATVYEGQDGASISGTRSSSFNVALPTIPRYTNITSYTRTNITLTSFRVNWASANTVDRVEYRINSGDWTLGQSGDRTSGNFTVSGRSPGTTYQVQIRVRRKDSGLWTNSSNVNVTTTDIAKITSAINFNDSQKPKINFSNPSGSRVDAFIGYNDGIGIWKNSIANTGSYEFNLSEAEWNILYENNYNLANFTIRYEIKTDNNNNWTNHVIRNMTIINANPIFSNFEYEDINPLTLNLTGDNQTIIKGYSNLKATITSANKMEAIKGANPKEYQLVVGSKQIKKDYHETNDVDLTLDAIENNVFIVYAIDSRYNSTQKQISPTEYIDYFRPVINDLVINRENNISTFVNLSFTGTFFNVDFGAEINEITAKYQYRNTKSDEWIDGDTELTLTISDNNFSFNNSIAGDLDAEGFSISESFEIKIIVEDLLSNNEKSEILVSATPNLSMHQDGTSINNQYDDSLGRGVQLNGENIYYNGNKLFKFDGNLAVGTELENVINNLIQNKFNLQAPMCGTILPVAGTNVNYGSYIVFDKTLIITASITATSNIAQYNNIMALSGGNKQLGGNCYVYSTDGKNCYLNKNNGMVAIYQSGGMTNGQTLVWEGIYTSAA